MWIKLMIIISFLLISNTHSQIQKQRKPLKKKRVENIRIMNDEENIKLIFRLYKENRYKEAEFRLRKIINSNPEKPWAKAMLALVEMKKGNVQNTRRLAADLLKKNKNSFLAHLVLAGFAKQNGQKLAAADHLRKAKKVANKPLEIEILNYIKTEFKLTDKPDLRNSRVQVQMQDNSTNLPVIAVFPFEDHQNESEALGKTVSEMMITALITTNRFKVIERSQLDKIMEEQALGQSGVLEDQTALDVGNILGVQSIVIGSISNLGNSFEIDVRLLNAANGEIISASSKSVNNESQIRNAVNTLSNELARDASKIPMQTEQESVEQDVNSKVDSMNVK